MLGMNRVPLALIAIFALTTLSSWCMAVDIIQTSDGKTLKGEIIRETSRTIVFRYVDPDLGFETTIVIPKSTITKTERNVADEDLNTPANVPVADEPSSSSDPASATNEPSAQEADVDKTQRATTVYVVPMIGQIGTDVSSRVYEEIIEDINEHAPDLLVFKLDSHDQKDEFNKEPIDAIEGDLTILMDRGEGSLWNTDGIREMRTLFDQEISDDIRQVLWVHDAHGDSGVLAMAWPEMYMHPDATLGGMSSYVVRSRQAAGDAHVAAKWGDASYHNIRGIMNYGGHQNPTVDKLISALCKPEYLLSVSFRGRMPMWQNNLRGEVPLDPSDEMGLTLPALYCDDFSLSNGTAAEIEDLAVLLGERNYVLVEGIAIDVQKRHTLGWRKAYKDFLEQIQMYRQWLGRGGMSNLTKAEKSLVRAIGLLRRWPEVGIRTRATVTDLELRLDEIKRMKKRGGKGGRGGSGGGGGGGLAR